MKEEGFIRSHSKKSLEEVKAEAEKKKKKEEKEEADSIMNILLYKRYLF